MTRSHLPAGALTLWRALLGLPPAAAPSAWPGRTGWIASLSPALLADLAPAEPLDAAVLQEVRLLARYRQTRLLQALAWIAEADVPCVALKGFAAAFLYYPAPAARLIGDLDLLVRERDLPRLVRALQEKGFRFGPADPKAWGFLSDASFVPFHTADGDCNVDLHVKPDSFPLSASLSTDEVFAQARQIMAADRPVHVPSAVHMALILVSNLAKDKFAPNGLRKLLDFARLLRHEHDFPWGELIGQAERARLGKALETTCALLRGLGTPAELMPERLGRKSPALIAGVLRDWCAQLEPGLLRRLQREWLLAAEPGVALRLAGRRLAGLIRPRSGIPAGLDG